MAELDDARTSSTNDPCSYYVCVVRGTPTLGQLAWAAAVFDDDPLADDREFLDKMAERVKVVKSDADGDDVLFAARLARLAVAG